jgi:S1-C subfamily serine protease
VKEFLSQKGVPYTEKYVDQDRAAAIEMIRRSGQQGVPVTVIGDEVVVGFDRPRLERIVAMLSQKTAAGGKGRKSLGAQVADASRYALPSAAPMQGAYVGGVKHGSPAEAAGMRVGDVIVQVGSTPVTSVDDLTAALGKLGSGPVQVTTRRGSNVRSLTVEL